MKKIVPPEMPVGAKSGNQPERALDEALDGLEEGAEGDQAPEAVDDRGHGGEQVDEGGGGPAHPGGAYWVMKSATPTPTGTEMSMASVEAATVVQRNSRMPKAGSSPPGAQTRGR